MAYPAASKTSGRLPEMSASTLKLLPQAALTGLVCECAASGDVEGLRALVAARADPSAGTSYDHRTPLHLAAAAGQLVMAQFLIEKCEATLQQDRFGLLPIHDAVQGGHIEVKRYLQNQKLADQNWERQKSPASPGSGSALIRGCSLENVAEKNIEIAIPEIKGTVFELVVKEGLFSYTAVKAEVHYFFDILNFHGMYFQHFTPLQIAKHVHCLIAAKHVACATNDAGGLEFDFKSQQSGFFLSTISSPSLPGQEPTGAQKRTEDRVADFLARLSSESSNGINLSLTFMASDGPAFQNGQVRLGIYNLQQGHFVNAQGAQLAPADGETRLDAVASARFLQTKTAAAKEQYQVVMEEVVASRGSIVRVVPGHLYPGDAAAKGGVVIFATAEVLGHHFLVQIWQAMRFAGITPRRFYFENFANGVLTYSLFFPSASQEKIQQLKRTIMYTLLLRATPGRSGLVFSSVMQSKISHECGLYLLAAVKFVYTFFPKEQYAREYTSVHEVLEQDGASQRKLEALYRLCTKDLLSMERIYQLALRHMPLARLFYEDFRSIAIGQAEPCFNKELGAAIDAACSDLQDRQILRMFLAFNESILLTNFFKSETPGALAFRLNPAVALKDRPTSLYPEVPYAIYLVIGRQFMGFHTRFRDVARGGIRLVLSRDKPAHRQNFGTLFDECYNLAFTQQNKNKDIPEGGAKGVILPDFSAGSSVQSPAANRSCFTLYLNALLDCMMPEQSGIYAGHMQGQSELLFFGPDENTAGFMDLGAELAQLRGYPYWKALTTGKSVALGGVPHDTYGMTTSSVHSYVTELLRELGEEEAKITKFQTGGPDGDLGSNEILISKDRTVAVVDGSGVLYDAAGLHRGELTRLARQRLMVREFDRSFLGTDGFLITVDQSDVVLPDGSKWFTGSELRDNFHLTDYATADLFVPCGGRPNSVTTENVHRLFDAGGKPKFRMVVEGANLFLSDGARRALETAGVHVFRDASTNKGGVNSSSLEVLAALALSVPDHSSLMCYRPEDGGAAPEFYQEYVKQIQDIIVDNARQEFRAIWFCNQRLGLQKIEATKLISSKITRMQDNIMNQFTEMAADQRGALVRRVLQLAIPPVMVQHLGIDGILQSVPPNYIAAVVASWVASRFVYREGINASEVSFFFFMQSLLEA